MTKASFESKLKEARSYLMMGKFIDAEEILDSLFDVKGNGWDTLMEVTGFMGNHNAAIMSMDEYYEVAGTAYSDLSEAYYRCFLLSMKNNNIPFASASLFNASRANKKARDKVPARMADLAVRISYLDSKIAFAEGSLDEGVKNLVVIRTLFPMNDKAKKIKAFALQELQRIEIDQKIKRTKNTLESVKQYTDLYTDLIEISDWLAGVIRALS